MRYFLIGLLALLSLEASSTNSVNPAHIRGVVKDFKGGDVIMMINRKKEVVQVDDNGVFDYTTTLKEPAKPYYSLKSMNIFSRFILKMAWKHRLPFLS